MWLRRTHCSVNTDGGKHDTKLATTGNKTEASYNSGRTTPKPGQLHAQSAALDV